MIKLFSFVALCLCAFSAGAQPTLSQLAHAPHAIDHIGLQPTEKVVSVTTHDVLIDKITDKYNVPHDLASSIVACAHTEAQAKNLDPVLILSIVAVESSFDPKAEYKGAVGLMQTIPRWHRDKVQNLGLSQQQLTSVEPNLKLGVEILREYLKLSNGNLTVALQKYNGSVKDKSRRYSNKIMREYMWFTQKD